MDNTYIFSMQEQLERLESELNGLNAIIVQRPLNRYEYRAAERTLQLLIESCIGIAKHWSYALTKTASADAYNAFEKLTQAGVEEVEPIKWRKIIGMRNALVHDYLNIEPEIIRVVIKQSNYQALFQFAKRGILALSALYPN